MNGVPEQATFCGEDGPELAQVRRVGQAQHRQLDIPGEVMRDVGQHRQIRAGQDHADRPASAGLRGTAVQTGPVAGREWDGHVARVGYQHLAVRRDALIQPRCPQT